MQRSYKRKQDPKTQEWSQDHQSHLAHRLPQQHIILIVRHLASSASQTESSNRGNPPRPSPCKGAKAKCKIPGHDKETLLQQDNRIVNSPSPLLTSLSPSLSPRLSQSQSTPQRKRPQPSLQKLNLVLRPRPARSRALVNLARKSDTPPNTRSTMSAITVSGILGSADLSPVRRRWRRQGVAGDEAAGDQDGAVAGWVAGGGFGVD